MLISTRWYSGRPIGSYPPLNVVTPSIVQRTDIDGINIRLIRDESKEVRWIELQLLEGADARLSHSQGLDRSDWDRKPSRRIQTERMAKAGQNHPRHDSDALIGVGVLPVQSCLTTFELWKTLLDTYEKKVAATKIYLIRRLYNMRMNESDSVQTHLNEYESLSSQISAQGTTIEDELRSILLMSRLPPSWETFVSTMCNRQLPLWSIPKLRAQSWLKHLGGNHLQTIRLMMPT